MIDRDALHQIVLDHAGQVYDATLALRQAVRATQPDAPFEAAPPCWAELPQSQRKRFVCDTAAAMADVHAALATVSATTT